MRNTIPKLLFWKFVAWMQEVVPFRQVQSYFSCNLKSRTLTDFNMCQNTLSLSTTRETIRHKQDTFLNMKMTENNFPNSTNADNIYLGMHFVSLRLLAMKTEPAWVNADFGWFLCTIKVQSTLMDLNLGGQGSKRKFDGLIVKYHVISFPDLILILGSSCNKVYFFMIFKVSSKATTCMSNQLTRNSLQLSLMLPT